LVHCEVINFLCDKIFLTLDKNLEYLPLPLEIWMSSIPDTENTILLE